MKRNHTEKELLDNDKLQVFRLAQLAQKDRELFESVCNELGFMVSFNNREGLDTTFANRSFRQLLELDEHEIIAKGFELIESISDRDTLNQGIALIKKYHQANEPERICSFLQRLKTRGAFGWLVTHKTVFDEISFINCGYSIKDIGRPGVIITDILDEVFVEKNGWEKFDSLSVREKDVLSLVAKGLSNIEISDDLFLSEHTIKTHRRNIYRKLEIKSTPELVRFSQAFDMI